ncbi:MAG: VOC family protein [Bacillota bacterium]
MTMRFGDIRLLTGDYAGTFRFYRDIMQLALDWGHEQSGYAQFRLGSTVLALLERHTMAETLPVVAPTGDHCVLSFVVDDVDGSYQELCRRGARPAGEPQDRADWGYRVAHVRDPEGNLIELYASLGESTQRGYSGT